MTPDDLKRYRTLRDCRFNRAWWAFFLLGCLGVFVSAFTPDGSIGSAWLILCGLSCMIVGRQQYARRLAQADAYADLQAARAEAAKAAMAREAKRAAELQARSGRKDQEEPPRP